jgi:hypothetical protein
MPLFPSSRQSGVTCGTRLIGRETLAYKTKIVSKLIKCFTVVSFPAVMEPFPTYNYKWLMFPLTWLASLLSISMKLSTYASSLCSYTSEHTFPNKYSFSEDFHMAIIGLYPSSRSHRSPATGKPWIQDLSTGFLNRKLLPWMPRSKNPWQII